MEKTHADAIAQAILEPDLQAQAVIRAKRAGEAAQLKRQRKIAVFTLAGSAVGAVTAHLLGIRFTSGIIWGGLASAALCWLVTRPCAA